MSVKGRGMIGPIIGMGFAVVLLIIGFQQLIIKGEYEMMLLDLNLTWMDVNFNPDLFYAVMLFNVMISFTVLIGTIIALHGNVMENAVVLIGGIVGVCGMFISVGTLTWIWDFGVVIHTEIRPLMLTSNFLVPLALILGGILGLTLREKRIY